MQTVKPRVRVHAANNPYSIGGFYYIVRGGCPAQENMQVGCACIDRALDTWYTMALLHQVMK